MENIQKIIISVGLFFLLILLICFYVLGFSKNNIDLENPSREDFSKHQKVIQQNKQEEFFPNKFELFYVDENVYPEGLKVFSSPDINSNIVLIISKGQSVYLAIDENREYDGWIMVTHRGLFGYIQNKKGE